MSWEPFLRDKLRMYPHQEMCKRQILAAMAVYKDLRPSTEKFVHNDGRQTDLFILEGTIPVNFRSNIYNIPVCIFLQETHPFIPPMVFVRPTTGMAIKVSKHVDNSGKVFLPYLAEWTHPGSDLTSLIQILCCIFAEEPPVYSRPVGYHPQQQQQQQQRTDYRQQFGMGYSLSNTPPYPPGNSPRMPSPMSMPMPDAGQRPSYQTPYPPTSSNSSSFSVPTMPYPSPGGGYPPVSQSTPSSTSSQRTSQNLLQTQSSISEDQIKRSLISAVEDKLRRSLKATIEQAQIELDELDRTQQQLKQGSNKLEDMIRSLEKEQSDVENNIKVLTQKNEEISGVISKLEGESENLNIDDAVVTTAPLYNQILSLFAEENAVEDTIYYLSESLRKEAISSEVFLKQVRTLSRKQFMLRALLHKARKTAGLSDLAVS
ncbi:tumor susceptibility gene 101 protein-like isoform X2 [Actinia tenebrosa]|uniref:Tumor susceptibility gene 101 protein-like isoform X2 n=1 Tax=Actinia tenebrosa TaxID=6105 RepID=A0A6P8ICV1_ACTTE|nr:tumor susceptibility gene 101 protein-like isoform X2 [Actinia tenebrosa]